MIKTIPFNTATPNRAMNPIPAEILKGIPLSKSESTPPMAAIGMAVKIRMDCLMEPNVKYRRTKIKSSAAGTAIERRA